MAAGPLGAVLDSFGEMPIISSRSREDYGHMSLLHFRLLISALNEAGVQPRSLSIKANDAACRTCNNDWKFMRLDNLVQLSVNLYLERESLCGSDILADSIFEALGKDAALKKIELSNHATPAVLEYLRDHPQFLLPNVTHLTIYNAGVADKAALDSLLQMLPGLKDINVYGMCLKTEPKFGQAWYEFFVLLRSKGITGYFFRLRAQYRPERQPKSEADVNACESHKTAREVARFVAGKGFWTAELDRMFRTSMS